MKRRCKALPGGAGKDQKAGTVPGYLDASRAFLATSSVLFQPHAPFLCVGKISKFQTARRDSSLYPKQYASCPVGEWKNRILRRQGRSIFNNSARVCRRIHFLGGDRACEVFGCFPKMCSRRANGIPGSARGKSRDNEIVVYVMQKVGTAAIAICVGRRIKPRHLCRRQEGAGDVHAVISWDSPKTRSCSVSRKNPKLYSHSLSSSTRPAPWDLAHAHRKQPAASPHTRAYSPQNQDNPPGRYGEYEKIVCASFRSHIQKQENAR